MHLRLGIRFAAQTLAVWIVLLIVPICVSAGPKKKLPSHPLDLNRATLQQLEQLPDIGPARARAIFKFRQISGPLERVEDLLAVRGISRKRLDKIRPYVSVGRRDNPAASAHRPTAKAPTQASSPLL